MSNMGVSASKYLVRYYVSGVGIRELSETSEKHARAIARGKVSSRETDCATVFRGDEKVCYYSRASEQSPVRCVNTRERTAFEKLSTVAGPALWPAPRS